MMPRVRTFLFTLLRYLVTVALIAYVAATVDVGEVAVGFRRSAWWGPAGAGVLLVLNLGLQWLRWHTLVRTARLDLSALRSLRILFSGYPLGFITPARFGEFGRGAVVAGEHDSVSVAGLTALERVFALMGMIGLAIAAIILTGYGPLWKWIIILTVYLIALYLTGHPYRLAAWISRLVPMLPGRIRETAARWTDRFIEGWRLAGRRAALKVYILSLLQSMTVLVQLTLCYFAAGAAAPLIKAFGSWAIVLGAKYSLPTTVGDVGVRESLTVILFADRNLPTPEALVAALIIYLLNVLLPVLAGSLLLLKGRNSRRFSQPTGV